MKWPYTFLMCAILCAGLYLRLYHIEFGLPHSFYADEPELAEPAVKYTYELRNIIKENSFYKLIPISFVYGTFPVYLYTICTMFFSKIMNLMQISFDKSSIYIFLRITTSLSSILIPLLLVLLSRNLFGRTKTALIVLLLTAFNWKLIVHAHYLNADLIQTILITASLWAFHRYYLKNSDTKFTLLTGIFYGLAIGTKITTLITLPLYLYVFIKKRNYRELTAFLFVIFGVYMLSNPFSFILANNFAFRIYTMFFKEGGMVFDSVDTSAFKYLSALLYMANPVVLLISSYGISSSLKEKKVFDFHVFLILHLVIYLAFFSLQSRRIDRWLLPILPIVILYASLGFDILSNNMKKLFFIPFFVLFFGSYLYFPYLLLHQFARNTPRSEAYQWMQQNLNPSKNKLVYTEEGLDPMNKLEGARVIKMQVYSSENAQFFMPQHTDGYHYVIISPRPMENYKRTEVRQAYPFYYEKWKVFEENLQNEEKFRLYKQFVLPKPNLIPLSDILIYENLSLVEKE